MEENKKYKISADLAQELIEFFENPFDGTKDAIQLLKSGDPLSEQEINKVVAVLGKFPAFAVYQVLGKLSTKIEEVEA